jgi:hypothetical protein
LNRPHANNARFVHTFIRTLTSTPIAIATYLRILRGMALILFSLAAPMTLQADTCESIGSGASQSISAQITINGTSTTVADQDVLPIGTQIRIDSVATAYGNCVEMFWNCNGGCSCVPSGTVFNRTINHISVTYDASTAGSLNGNYSLGDVIGLNPDGTTAHWNVLDTQAANSTGPKYFTLSVAGTFQFHFRGIINTTNCNILPSQTETIDITLYVGDKDGGVDFGSSSCNSNVAPAAVGKPINVTNGNMYIQQADYRLPGFGEGLEVTRTYNSKMQRSGIFGYGWSSAWDESIKCLRHNFPASESAGRPRGLFQPAVNIGSVPAEKTP